MKNRLSEFMRLEGLSSAKIAEITGVQPSAISHLLSGRNKPGFDFIAKLLDAFPNLNARWLILNEGDIYCDLPVDDKDTASMKNLEPIIIGDLFYENKNNLHEPDKSVPFDAAEEIEQIIIFYKDGRFKLYKQ